MRKITIFLIGVFMLMTAGKVMALTPPPITCSVRAFIVDRNYQLPYQYDRYEIVNGTNVRPGDYLIYSFDIQNKSGIDQIDLLKADMTQLSGANEPIDIVQVRAPNGECVINSSNKSVSCNLRYAFTETVHSPIEYLIKISDKLGDVQKTSSKFSVETSGGSAECANYFWIKSLTSPTLAPTQKYAKEGERCGASTMGVVRCEPGLRCNIPESKIDGGLGVPVYKEGTGGTCVKDTPTVKPTIVDNCRLKVCGDANCDGIINSMDLVLWKKEFSERKGNSADFNSDNKVDKTDYDLLQLGLQKKCGTYAKEGEFCGAGPNGVVKCESGLKCNEPEYEVDEQGGSISKMKTGAGGICVRIIPTSKPTPVDNCRLKVCGDANCDGKIDSKDRLVWIKERFTSSRTADFNKDGKIDSKDYSIMTSGIQNKCQPTIIPRVTTPFPTKKVITQTPTPTYTCSVLYEKNINSEPNNFKNCLSSGFPKICFDKYTGVYQGCGTLERDTCTEFNTNAARNIQCDSNMGTVTSVPTISPLAPSCCQSTIKPNSGKAPLTVILYGCGSAGNGPGFDGYRWDFDGDGSWDTRGLLIDAVTYSYTKAGVYRPKFQIHGVNNVWSEVCDYGYDVVVTGGIPTKIPTLVPCKEGPSNFSVDTSCGDNLFRYATYVCFDGFKGRLGNDASCKTAVEFSIEARKMCVNHGSSCMTLSPTYKPKEPTLTPTGKPISVRPTGNLGCDRNGDGDGDGAVTLKDYAAWRYEYSISKPIKSDFNCDRKIDKSDYEIWKKAFLSTKELTVSTEN